MSEESKSRGGGGGGGGGGVSATSDLESQYYYGTFQGIPNAYPPPPQPVVGFPQPLPPPGATGHPRYPHTHYPPPHPHHHHHGYQTDPGYAVVEGHPVRLHRLPCCGLGLGWFLFLIGFFLGGIPWYVGAIILLCVRVDYREKPGYVACTIASILALIAVTLGITKGTHAW